jgi:FkbM family methyltransferase
MRRGIVKAVRSKLANERAERLLIGAAERVPWAWWLIFGLTPQPENYAASDERIVTRHGLRFRLRPGHYFQWHHLFKRHDAVLDVLRGRARGRRVFIDVGANIGLYSLVVRQAMCTEGRVLSIEPSATTAATLREHVAWSAQPGVEVFECALSSKSGTAQLAERKDDWGKASLTRAETGQTRSTVRTRTLDELVRETGLELVDLIKIDVEGHELEVLKGAKDTIERFLPTIVIEYSPQWMSEAAIAEMTGYLERLVSKGYVAYRILPGRLDAVEVSGLEATPSQANLLLVSPRS